MTVFEIEKISQRRAAVIAGITMLFMAICVAFAVGFVNSSLFVNGDAKATTSTLHALID